MTRLDAAFLGDPGAQAVTAMLADAGHQVWFVGGCVRNALMGVAVSDIDMTTDAHPDRVMALADRAGLATVPTGYDHGTVTVISNGSPFEITTFRRDVATDGRHASVTFSTRIEDDAARRDFTMNALYAAPDGTLADPLGGLPDLLARRVRFIGQAEDRIREDYLRILRFFRFHAVYGDAGLGVDADGLAACAAHIDGLARLSPERTGAEMRKLLCAPDPAPAVAAMAACGALGAVLPGASAATLPVLLHIEQALALPPEPIRRLASIGGNDPQTRLRLSRQDSRRLRTLLTAMVHRSDPAALGYRLGATDALDVLALHCAATGQMPDAAAPARIAFGAAQTCPVNAADLMPDLQGPALGQRLRDIEDRWIASGFTLGKSALIG